MLIDKNDEEKESTQTSYPFFFKTKHQVLNSYEKLLFIVLLNSYANRIDNGDDWNKRQTELKMHLSLDCIMKMTCSTKFIESIYQTTLGKKRILLC